MTLPYLTVLLQAPDSTPYVSSLLLVLGLGFAAATVIGSIAWYNAKRPLGWEDKRKPDVVPDIHDA